MHIAVCMFTFTLRNTFVGSYMLFMIKSSAGMANSQEHCSDAGSRLAS
jgi:hypothetical protein